MRRYSKLQAGFTLVEMIAVIAIFVVIGSITMTILLTSFRTSNKADVVTTVQQNGSYALTQIAKTLRDARGLVHPFPCNPSVSVSSVSILTPDNKSVTYSCQAAGILPATIASNGATLLDTNQVNLASCSFTCSQDSSSDIPIIQVQFSLQHQSSSNVVEQLASNGAVPFQTSVVLRNINR